MQRQPKSTSVPPAPLSQEERPRLQSHISVRLPASTAVVEQHIPTLPPPPFAVETDVPALDWWFEHHMALAQDLLCLELAQPGDARAQLMRLLVEALRDALYDLYCDAADPRLAPLLVEHSSLRIYVEALYSWTRRVTAALKDRHPEGMALKRELENTNAVHLANVFVVVEEMMTLHAISVTNPVEPLRNLQRDWMALFRAMTQARDLVGMLGS